MGLTSGSFTVRDSEGHSSAVIDANDDYSLDITLQGYLIFDGVNDDAFSGSISEISIKAILDTPVSGSLLNTDIGMESGDPLPNAAWEPNGNNSDTAVTEYRTDVPYEGSYYLYCSTSTKGTSPYNRGEVKMLDHLGYSGPLGGRFPWYTEMWIGFMFRPINCYTPLNTGDVGWCGIIQSHAW